MEEEREKELAEKYRDRVNVNLYTVYSTNYYYY
jgi:hypothetical protein